MSDWVFGEPGPVRQPPFPGRFGEEDGEEQRVWTRSPHHGAGAPLCAEPCPGNSRIFYFIFLRTLFGASPRE